MKVNPFSVVLVGVIAYLSYHAIAGRHGLSEWGKMQDQLVVLEAERDGLILKKQMISDDISRLYDESLDLDLLEEIARNKFHFVYPDEYMLEPPALTSQHPENEELFDLSNFSG